MHKRHASPIREETRAKLNALRAELRKQDEKEAAKEAKEAKFWLRTKMGTVVPL